MTRSSRTKGRHVGKGSRRNTATHEAAIDYVNDTRGKSAAETIMDAIDDCTSMMSMINIIISLSLTDGTISAEHCIGDRVT